MTTYANTMAQITNLLETGKLAETEQLLDEFAEMDPDDLDEEWGLGTGGARYHLSVFYNNVGANYHGLGREAQKQGQPDKMLEAAEQAERCHEKALDMYDVSADDLTNLPAGSPLSKNVIFTFWGLGTSKFVLEKREESRKYLELCLIFSPEDEQAKFWQSDASSYLRVLDGKPVQIVVRVNAAMGNPFDPHILHVQGELLEWDSYVKPRRTEYHVYLTDDLIDELEAKGFRDPSTFEGAILVLNSHESGDLRRPMSLIQLL